MSDAHIIRDEAKKLESELHRRWKQLEEIEHTCQHEWGGVEYVPIYREGYTVLSDLSRGVYLGVDTTVSDVHVPAANTRQWQRTCQKCGKVQKTTAVKKEFTPGSIPGCGAEMEVPNFGDK